MLIETRPALDPELAALVTAQQRELTDAGARAGERIFEPRDDIEYLVGVVNGRAVACGGWRAGEPEVAEITRMYVRPAHRGRGLGRQMIVALEEEALAAGRLVIRLETAAHLLAVIALYQSSGYARIPAYGDPRNICFEKRLPALVQ
ncbi:putative GCN5-related N-acetyltransferase [Actinoplanes missouriensis 431]|uniref:Putative GCN5-related N-acetyltransferase n=1 Tax=Actinoplanes missouriensis (strain ATCC 14538 / DSM 43046 / CBS 188.64 / JCM 3121 / NBRC 102363 / NCIMB 12654 / NRRL B-3342 / UNCC 431) TaxID=512565 RepID=I0H030_ACTM4|nr:GNAT family N-acetyltransferase [Actinoplanes missouriensis]BAL86367.1 putative GCN5-related N-acetyltransferase [Actinoplanes missouriensis 431]